ncbi:MAG: cryptochrome/photolyase family protein [Pseudomonadales bacterium]
MRTLVWLRNDLRVADNPALSSAMEAGEAVAVFCICARQWRAHDVGDNRLGFLLDSLHGLAAELGRLGVPLRIITEPWFADVPRRLVKLATELGAGALVCNDEYPLNEQLRDAQVARACADAGIAMHMHHAGTLLPPGAVLTQSGEPYTVFSPFKKRWMSRLEPAGYEPLAVPRRQRRPSVADSPLPQRLDGVARDQVEGRWPGGPAEAQRRLQEFVSDRVLRYHQDRDFPALDGTSTLSPYLAVGSISARQCLHAAVQANGGSLHSGSPGVLAWINELVWRDFYRHVVAHFPHVSRGRAFRREMDAMPWRHAPAEYQAWKAGRTGYPLVDAAMRQLAETGWMHNRLRMVTAMFLSKHLLLDWRLGERHFMNLLVDGDFAANNGGWQWSAATGTDAAPYFRIFNPVTQAQRFDPQGTFVRRYVAELREAPLPAVLDPAKHGFVGYPRPMVDHRAARQRALDSFKALRRG